MIVWTPSVVRMSLPSGIKLCHPVKISKVHLWPLLRVRSKKMAKILKIVVQSSKFPILYRRIRTGNGNEGILSQFSTCTQKEKLVTQLAKNLIHWVTSFLLCHSIVERWSARSVVTFCVYVSMCRQGGVSLPIVPSHILPFPSFSLPSCPLHYSHFSLFPTPLR